MGIEWADSAAKHGIPREDVLYVMGNPETQIEQGAGKLPGEVVVLYIGHPHSQTERYVEVVALLNRRRGSILIFHAMPLRDMNRHHLEG